MALWRTIISRATGGRPLFSPRKFVFDFAVARLRGRAAFLRQSDRPAPLPVRRQSIRLSIFQQIFVALFLGQPFAKRHCVEPVRFNDRMGRALRKIRRFKASSGRLAKRFVILYPCFPNRNANLAQGDELHA